MINWSLFPTVINEYAQLGYSYIEVPWLVDKESIMATIPSFAKPLMVDAVVEPNQLVGSAEQSFLYLALKNELPKGKYMALTPCFRDDKVDEFHKKYFMKLELIDIGKEIYPSAVINLMNDARYVLSKFAKKTIVIQPTDDGTDLILNDIEIGSYGKRSHKDIKWAYGTGLAEPRFSQANEYEKVSLKESKAKYYQGHACYQVLYDHAAGMPNRYTVYFETANDPLIIGRELDLKFIREALIPKYENYLERALKQHDFVYMGDRSEALLIFTAVNGKIYEE